MRIIRFIPLLACAIAASPCLGLADTVGAPVQGQDADTLTAACEGADPVVLADDTLAGKSSAAELPDDRSIGIPVDARNLDQLRGGDGTVDNDVLIDGTVGGNTADHVVSGANAISDGAFTNANGINTVIQNTGSNVLIQNGMVVNVQFVAPSP